jgi:hypothetical protein
VCSIALSLSLSFLDDKIIQGQQTKILFFVTQAWRTEKYQMKGRRRLLQSLNEEIKQRGKKTKEGRRDAFTEEQQRQ